MASGASEKQFDDFAAAQVAAFDSAPLDLVRDLRWAGLTVRVRIAGRSLARLFLRTVPHLLLQSHEPVCRPEISIFLTEPRDTPAVHALRQVGDGLPRSWNAPDLDIRSSDCGRMLSFAFHQSRFVLDRETRTLAGVQEPARLVLFERTKPLLLPLRVLLQDRGIHVLHAGLVATQEGGVLIGGAARAGKSSTALMCVMAGFDFLGDDQVGLASSEEVPVGHSLYSAVQLEPEWLARLGSFPPRALEWESAGEKVGLFLSEVIAERLRRSAPIRAIVLPRLDPNRRAGVVPATKAEALMTIAPSTLFQPLGAGSAGLSAVRRLVERVPSYWLDSGEDTSSVPESVRRVLRQPRQK